MSQENVETVRRAYEAFSRAGLDALLEHVHPDAEYDITAAIGPYAGMLLRACGYPKFPCGLGASKWL